MSTLAFLPLRVLVIVIVMSAQCAPCVAQPSPESTTDLRPYHDFERTAWCRAEFNWQRPGARITSLKIAGTEVAATINLEGLGDLPYSAVGKPNPLTYVVSVNGAQIATMPHHVFGSVTVHFRAVRGRNVLQTAAFADGVVASRDAQCFIAPAHVTLLPP